MRKCILFACLSVFTAFQASAQSSKGVAEINIQPLLQIYPNPAVAELNLVSVEPMRKVVIANILCQKVYEQNCHSNNVKINISALPPGMYYVKADEMPMQRVAKN